MQTRSNSLLRHVIIVLIGKCCSHLSLAAQASNGQCRTWHSHSCWVADWIHWMRKDSNPRNSDLNSNCCIRLWSYWSWVRRVDSPEVLVGVVGQGLYWLALVVVVATWAQQCHSHQTTAMTKRLCNRWSFSCGWLRKRKLVGSVDYGHWNHKWASLWVRKRCSQEVNCWPLFLSHSCFWVEKVRPLHQKWHASAPCWCHRQANCGSLTVANLHRQVLWVAHFPLTL